MNNATGGSRTSITTSLSKRLIHAAAPVAEDGTADVRADAAAAAAAGSARTVRSGWRGNISHGCDNHKCAPKGRRLQYTEGRLAESIGHRMRHCHLYDVWRMPASQRL